MFDYSNDSVYEAGAFAGWIEILKTPKVDGNRVLVKVKTEQGDNWLEFVLDTVGKDSLKGHKVLDVGCGTGELLLSFLKKEAEVTGLDLSAEMLMVAHAKAEKAGYKPFLIEQDMSEMTLMSQFDIVCAFCDSINYLENAMPKYLNWSSLIGRF